MRMADLMVFIRRWARPPRKGEEGRCLGGELERSFGEDVRRDVECPVVVPVVLPWEVAETRDVAEIEYGFVGMTSELLAAPEPGGCSWLDEPTRFVVELSADGNVETLLLGMVAWDPGTDSSFCPPLALPLSRELRLSSC